MSSWSDDFFTSEMVHCFFPRNLLTSCPEVSDVRCFLSRELTFYWICQAKNHTKSTYMYHTTEYINNIILVTKANNYWLSNKGSLFGDRMELKHCNQQTFLQLTVFCRAFPKFFTNYILPNAKFFNHKLLRLSHHLFVKMKSCQIVLMYP